MLSSNSRYIAAHGTWTPWGLFYITKSAKPLFHQNIFGKMEADEWAMELREKWHWTYPIRNYIEPDEPVIYDVHMDEIVPIVERSGSYYGLIFSPLWMIMEKALKLLMKKVTWHVDKFWMDDTVDHFVTYAPGAVNDEASQLRHASKNKQLHITKHYSMFIHPFCICANCYFYKVCVLFIINLSHFTFLNYNNNILLLL